MSVRAEPEDKDRAPGPGGGDRVATTRTATLPRGKGVGWFAVSGLVNAVGTGFFYPYQLLFFTAVTQLKLTTVGVSLTVATLLALPVVLVVGRYVDRWGTRTVLVSAALVRAGAFVAYIYIHDVVSLTVLATAAAVAQRAEQVSVPVLAAGIAPKQELGSWLAVTRVTFNAGMGLGGLLAGVALVGANSRSGFVLVGLINAASFVVAALLYLPLPTVRPAAARQSASGVRPWRHPLFLRVSLTNCLLLTIIVATEVGLPVYLVEHLHMAAWVVGLLFTVNTTLMVLVQLPVSSRLTRFPPLKVLAVGGLLHAALLVVLGSAGWLPSPARLPLLLLGAVLYTLGEILSTQVLAVLLVSLSPEREKAAYQAFVQVLVGLSLAVAPTLVAYFLAYTAAGLWWALAAAAGVVTLGALGLNRRAAIAEAKTG